MVYDLHEEALYDEPAKSESDTSAVLSMLSLIALIAGCVFSLHLNGYSVSITTPGQSSFSNAAMIDAITKLCNRLETHRQEAVRQDHKLESKLTLSLPKDAHVNPEEPVRLEVVSKAEGSMATLLKAANVSRIDGSSK